MHGLLVDTSEGTQVGTKRCAGPLTGVTVHLTSAIAIIIPRPLAYAVADGRMAWMAAPITLPLVGIEPCAAGWEVRRDPRGAGARIGMVTHPALVLAWVARHQTDEGWAIVGVGPVPFPCIGASPGRVSGIKMRRAFFPPPCGTVRRPQRPCPSSPWSGRSRSGWPEFAAVTYGAVCARAPIRARGVRWARPSPSRAATVPRSPGAAGFLQRRFL
jgi:hypothetical protein